MMERSLSNVSYDVPMGECRDTPVEGREMPGCSAGGHSAQTLKSCRCSRNGERENRISVARRASCSNLPRSAAVYPSPRISRSTLVAGSPIFWMVMSGPGDGGFNLSMNLSLGSMVVLHTSWKLSSLPSLRPLRVIFTGAVGAGKRTDSENVRLSFFASSVCDHSLKMDPKPREYSRRPLA